VRRYWPRADFELLMEILRGAARELTKACSWHGADMKLRPLFGRYGVESGLHLLSLSLSALTQGGRLMKRQGVARYWQSTLSIRPIYRATHESPT
jgi:hypothetical protein